MASMSSSAHSSSSARLTSPSSDSENYDANHSNFQSSDAEPPSSPSSSPMILYSPPTFWSIVRGAAINILLPFINGLMLGFGELVANEAAWRLGWGGTKIFPPHRNGPDWRPVGPGVVMVDDPIERRRRSGEEMDAYTSME